jgi:ABC-2 type transport system permease protein
VPEGNIDMGSTIGSYAVDLISAYSSIGIFTSLSDQIVAFILSVFLCFFYFGFEGLSSLHPLLLLFAAFGMQDHFKSMGRG